MSARSTLEWSPGAAGPLTDAEPDLSWQDAAACQYTDPEIFFPEKGGRSAPAKRVCLSCPARAECLEYALENEIGHGVWGGKSERQRQTLLAKRTRTAEVAAR